MKIRTLIAAAIVAMSACVDSSPVAFEGDVSVEAALVAADFSGTVVLLETLRTETYATTFSGRNGAISASRLDRKIKSAICKLTCRDPKPADAISAMQDYIASVTSKLGAQELSDERAAVLIAGANAVIADVQAIAGL